MLCTRYSQPNPHRMGLRRESDTDLRAGAGPTCSFGPELDVVVAGGGVWDRIPTLRRLHVAVPVGRVSVRAPITWMLLGELRAPLAPLIEGVPLGERGFGPVVVVEAALGAFAAGALRWRRAAGLEVPGRARRRGFRYLDPGGH